MNNSKLKLLLYSDGSYQALSAAVYTATLLQNTPQMDLTILQVKENDQGSLGVKYSWIELRQKYKKYSWSCSSESGFDWIDTWPVSPDTKWINHVLDKSNTEIKKQYAEIVAKTNAIFLTRKQDVHRQILCLNTSFSETTDTSETVDAIVDYATQNSFDLVIIGTRGISTLKGVIFGSLSHNVLNKSTIPVLLIKKLPQEFIDSYLSESES